MRINKGVIAILITVTIWGTSFIASKVALEDMGPFCLSFLRFLVAYIILAPVAFRKGYRFRLTFHPQYLLLGLTGVALFFSLQNLGLVFTSAGNSSLIMGGAPVAITILAILILKETPTREQLFGLGLTIFGIVLVSLAGIRDGFGKAPIIGSLFLIAAIITWGIYTIQGKRIAGGTSALVITTACIGGGLLFLVPLMLIEALIMGLPKVELGSILAVLYLGGFGSGLTLLLYNYALRFLDASAVAPYVNLTPVIGVIFATMTGEKTGNLQLIGGAVVLFGVWLSNKRTETPDQAE